MLAILVKHQIMNNRFGDKIVLGKFQCDFFLFQAHYARIDFPVQGFTSRPDLEIKDHRSLASRYLTVLQDNGHSGTTDVVCVTTTTRSIRVGYFDVNLYLIAFCFSSFHNITFGQFV